MIPSAPYYDVILSLTENTNADVETSLEHIPVVRVSLSELSDIAASQRETGRENETSVLPGALLHSSWLTHYML